jgi:hypothetical protein
LGGHIDLSELRYRLQDVFLIAESELCRGTRVDASDKTVSRKNGRSLKDSHLEAALLREVRA